MNYLPHCNATYISPFNLLKTCESSDIGGDNVFVRRVEQERRGMSDEG